MPEVKSAERQLIVRRAQDFRNSSAIRHCGSACLGALGVFSVIMAVGVFVNMVVPLSNNPRIKSFSEKMDDAQGATVTALLGFGMMMIAWYVFGESERYEALREKELAKLK